MIIIIDVYGKSVVYRLPIYYYCIFFVKILMNAMTLPIHTTALKVNMRCAITLLALLLAYVCKASK